ncbi:MAG TPA: hypothetical protein VFN78_02515 [Ktedonobacterales bacterium]|nr:hypothetical protein [Ktedonobacterales bacterium]
MASSDPVGDGFALLTSVLGGDATFMSYLTGIYEVMAPTGSAPDYCLLIHQSATDVNAATAARIMTTLLFQVKLVGPAADESNLRTAYRRGDTLLQPGGLALRNTNNTLSCFREQTFSIGELNNNGELWLNVGGLYRIEV